MRGRCSPAAAAAAAAVSIYGLCRCGCGCGGIEWREGRHNTGGSSRHTRRNGTDECVRTERATDNSSNIGDGAASGGDINNVAADRLMGNDRLMDTYKRKKTLKVYGIADNLLFKLSCGVCGVSLWKVGEGGMWVNERNRGECALIEKQTFLDKKVPKEEGYKTSESGLMYLDKTVGYGEAAEEGLVVQVHMQGTSSITGKTVENTFSMQCRKPVTFVVGSSHGRVIHAVDEGVRGMKEGGCRELLVPPRLGLPEMYKEILIYEIQLVKVSDYQRQSSLLNKSRVGEGLFKLMTWIAHRTSHSYGKDCAARQRHRDNDRRQDEKEEEHGHASSS
eukprot:GHVQ01010371.1.p1 GENE.GHVQ01010371.1~~GHVQ01010371.1.p1  ORF type:complete len:334 (-),score=85.22 GHVQ01010371.1:346-1347(-)